LETELVSQHQQVRMSDHLPVHADISRAPARGAPVLPSAPIAPVLKSIPLHLIAAVRNPRHAERAGAAFEAPQVCSPSTEPHARVDADLEGLARSLGTEEEPRLAEPPVVEEMPDGGYRLCAGERRVEAARLAGWTNILCLVYPRMDPARAHTLSLVENLHRAPMHPLEEISALCISRLVANADARSIGEEARRLLEEGWARSASSYSIIQDLERLLRESGWVPERPDVSWKIHLDDLGISMAPWERKRKLRMLNIDPGLQEQLRGLDITEAALRSLGTLEPEEQRRVVEALVANPSLARKVRRVARARRDGFYASIEDALAEVQGLTSAAVSPVTTASAPGATDSPVAPAALVAAEHIPLTAQSNIEHDLALSGATASSSNNVGDPGAQSPEVSPELQDAVLQLLECADRLAAAMDSLKAYSSGVGLPEPWRGWSRDALSFIKGLLPDRGTTEPPSPTSQNDYFENPNA
jgi:ParB-like chromosome segregation protein Spo0J